MSAEGLIVASSGTADESCVFLDGRVFYGISSINIHFKPSTSLSPRSMLKLVGSPFFGDEVRTFEEIIAKFDFVCSLGTKSGCDRFVYKGKPLGFISELYFGLSSRYGVVVEMDVEQAIVEDYRERFKMVSWITFDVVSNVEFTNA